MANTRAHRQEDKKGGKGEGGLRTDLSTYATSCDSQGRSREIQFGIEELKWAAIKGTWEDGENGGRNCKYQHAVEAQKPWTFRARA